MNIVFFFNSYITSMLCGASTLLMALMFSIKAIHEDSVLVSILGTLWALFTYLVIAFEPVSKLLGWL